MPTVSVHRKLLAKSNPVDDAGTLPVIFEPSGVSMWSRPRQVKTNEYATTVRLTVLIRTLSEELRYSSHSLPYRRS